MSSVAAMKPQVESVFDPVTGSFTHIVHSGFGMPAAVIDPVLGFDLKSGRTDPSTLEPVIRILESRQLLLHWILETHVHADHLSGAALLQQRFGGRIAIGGGVGAVHAHFAPIFGIAEPAGTQFDHLFADGEHFAVGGLAGEAMPVASHTPADIAYRIGDAVFLGDTLFAPDQGSARCDFPGGDARALYRAARAILALPGETRLFLCHDYPPEGRKPIAMTTVAEQRAANRHLRDGIGEEEFVAMRQARDATLQVPALILPAIQVNLRAGRLPDDRRLVIPVDAI